MYSSSPHPAPIFLFLSLLILYLVTVVDLDGALIGRKDVRKELEALILATLALVEDDGHLRFIAWSGQHKEAKRTETETATRETDRQRQAETETETETENM